MRGDDELEFDRLQHRQLAYFLALEDENDADTLAPRKLNRKIAGDDVSTRVLLPIAQSDALELPCVARVLIGNPVPTLPLYALV